MLSAYLKMRFAAVTGCRSAAVTRYDAGPSPVPWMTLAFTSATDEQIQAYRVQCLRHFAHQSILANDVERLCEVE